MPAVHAVHPVGAQIVQGGQRRRGRLDLIVDEPNHHLDRHGGDVVIGVHLDRRATQPHVDEIQAKIRDAGREA